MRTAAGSGRASAAWARLCAQAAGAGAVVRRVLGMPDYAAYLAHARAHHPGAPVLSHREFMQARLEDRYSRPGAKCC